MWGDVRVIIKSPAAPVNPAAIKEAAVIVNALPTT